MAYANEFILRFNNDFNEPIEIYLDKKDSVVTSPTVIEDLNSGGTNAGAAFDICEINKSSDAGLITDPIIWSELVFSISLAKDNTSINFQTFLTSAHDDWMVRMYCNGVSVFHGYLVPDEGSIALHDKPYDVVFKAVDGLKLLSNTTLSKIDGTEFSSKHYLSEYIAACLYKTGLELGFKIYCNIYHSSMDTRAVDVMNDMFQQAALDYRTFMTSATAFNNCYDVLQYIMKDSGCQLRYEEGFWIIYRLTEAQYLPDGNRYFTTYDFNGNAIAGAVNADDFALVGQNNINRPINEAQTLSAKFANKSVKHTLKYAIWDEIPRNNKFERGSLSIISPPAGSLFYDIDNWIYARENTITGLPVPLAATTDYAVRKSTYNAFNVETDREIQMNTTVDTGFAKMLRSDPIPVNQNDKVDISFQIRLTNTVSTPATYLACRVYIITGGTKYFLDDPASIGGISKWKTTFAAIGAIYASGDDSAQYLQIDIKSDTIPADGDLYIHFRADGTSAGANIFIKDFNLTLTPYVAGGYIPVKGDYWTRSQTSQVDALSEEVIISDSPIGAAKGTLWYYDGTKFIKTTTEWYRYGLTETKHFKELLNLGIYNLTYRRFLKIEGDFDGTTYVNNNNGMQYPLGFTPLYKFEDISASTLFMMCCPVKIDYAKARFSATFQEVYASSADGTQTGTTSNFKFLFE